MSRTTWYYDHLGDVYIKIGMRREAHEAWEKALGLKNLEEIKLKIDKFGQGDPQLMKLKAFMLGVLLLAGVILRSPFRENS